MDEERLLRIAQKVAAKQIKRELQWWQDCCHDPPPEEAPKYWRRDIPNEIYNQIWREKQSTTIKWVAPNIDDERERIQKAAESLGLDVDDVQFKATNGWLDKLSGQIWAMLSNSDSWTVESMEEAEVRAAMRDEDLQPIIDIIAAGKSLPSPIILILGDGTPHLLSGNDKLMVARAMDTDVQAFFVDLATTPKSSDMPDMPVTGYRDRQGPVPAR